MKCNHSNGNIQREATESLTERSMLGTKGKIKFRNKYLRNLPELVILSYHNMYNILLRKRDNWVSVTRRFTNLRDRNNPERKAQDKEHL